MHFVNGWLTFDPSDSTAAQMLSKPWFDSVDSALPLSGPFQAPFRSVKFPFRFRGIYDHVTIRLVNRITSLYRDKMSYHDSTLVEVNLSENEHGQLLSLMLTYDISTITPGGGIIVKSYPFFLDFQPYLIRASRIEEDGEELRSSLCADALTRVNQIESEDFVTSYSKQRAAQVCAATLICQSSMFRCAGRDYVVVVASNGLGHVC